MIDECRDYFKKVVKRVDPDLKHDGLLDETEKIGSTVLDNTYKLYFKDLRPETMDGSIESELDVELVIYKRIGTKSVEEFDKAYCKAIDIHALAQNRAFYNQENTIKEVECTDIIPERIESDSLSFRFILEFTVRLGYVYNYN